MDLNDVAIELYREVPSDFTAARNARAKQVASAGDRDLAAEIRRLPKTSAAVWTLNQLRRQRDTDISDKLRTLGSQLRDAQEHANRAKLDQLLGRRRIFIKDTTKILTDLAAERGVRLSPSAVAEIEQSLQAALADEDGSTAVLSGRLVRPLQSDGLVPVDLSGALAGSPVTARAGRLASPASEPVKTTAKESKAHVALIARTRKAADAADAAVEKVHEQQVDLEADRGALDHDVEMLQAQFDLLQKRRDELDERSKRIARDSRSAVETSRKARAVADRAAATSRFNGADVE